MAKPIFGASVASDTVSVTPQPLSFRLGDAATPIRDTVHLTIDPRIDYFTSEIAIYLNLNPNLDVRCPHAQQIAIQSVTLGAGGTSMSPKTVAGGKDSSALQ